MKFLEQERKREEEQIQDQIIEDDLALIRDREERIRQLEVQFSQFLSVKVKIIDVFCG